MYQYKEENLREIFMNYLMLLALHIFGGVRERKGGYSSLYTDIIVVQIWEFDSPFLILQLSINKINKQ